MQRQRVERVQRLFSRINSVFSSLSYERRLSLLNMQTLYSLVNMSKLIILCMIKHNVINYDLEQINLSINVNNIRANGPKLVLLAPRTNILLHSFAFTAGTM